MSQGKKFRIADLFEDEEDGEQCVEDSDMNLQTKSKVTQVSSWNSKYL